MRVVEAGKTQEIRGFFWHCIAIFRPGTTVPVFEQPLCLQGELKGVPVEDVGLIIEEGRRQFDRQAAFLEHLRTNAGVLLTLGLAEAAFLANGADASFGSAWYVWVLWLISATSVALGLLGALGVLTAKAVFGSIDTLDLAEATEPRPAELARRYADGCRIGQATNYARITVIRDAVFLLVAGGILYAAAWPFQV